MSRLSHVDQRGRARMVDVTEKDSTLRVAVAAGIIRMKAETREMIRAGGIKKGPVLETARIAGVMGVKRTAELIPMCHQLMITGIEIEFSFLDEQRLEVRGTVRTTGKTGVEMEALTGVSIAALTVYDMCKAVDKEMVIGEIRLLRKSGGKSGDFIRES